MIDDVLETSCCLLHDVNRSFGAPLLSSCDDYDDVSLPYQSDVLFSYDTTTTPDDDVLS